MRPPAVQQPQRGFFLLYFGLILHTIHQKLTLLQFPVGASLHAVSDKDQKLLYTLATSVYPHIYSNWGAPFVPSALENMSFGKQWVGKLAAGILLMKKKSN